MSTLRDICRSTEASVGGNKDELIERIISHFAHRRDQREEEPAEPPRVEARRLDQRGFETLFTVFHHQELADILRRYPEYRQTGTKETKISTLWEAHLAETTFLGELMNRQLEDALQRLGLKLSGSKNERIERIIGHFASRDVPTAAEGTDAQGPLVVEPKNLPIGTHVLQHQDLFRQKSSNPQASLQPWLEQLLDGVGQVRCYATDDANPTKQLKNKLSQAAAASGGLLVLMLADKEAFAKAREALIERWLANAEWPKSVACVALAYPPAHASIETIIERTKSPWARRLRECLFPNAEVIGAKGESAEAAKCPQCHRALPMDARFCPNCGTGVDAQS